MYVCMYVHRINNPVIDQVHATFARKTLISNNFNISRHASVTQTEYRCQQMVASNSSLDHTICKQHDVLKHHKVTGSSRVWWISSGTQRYGKLWNSIQSGRIHNTIRLTGLLFGWPFRHFHALSCKHVTKSRLKIRSCFFVKNALLCNDDPTPLVFSASGSRFLFYQMVS